MRTPESLKIGIFAPSSPVSPAELELGLLKLGKAGLDARVLPQTLLKNGLYAGSDEERAKAFHVLAHDPDVPVVWAARGGYGAIRILAELEKLDAAHGIPPPGKLYVGFSDSTVLIDYVRARWNWSVLHASMPGHRGILQLASSEWKAILGFLKNGRAALPASFGKLRWLTPAPTSPIEGELFGGNLACLAALIGTRHEAAANGRILFLEDVTESWSRIDRMVETLLLSDALKNVRAIVLGNFLDCSDASPPGLASTRSLKRMAPTRKALSPREAERFVFGRIHDRTGIPIASGLPCGHGPGKFPLPMDAKYLLSNVRRGGKASASLEFQGWRWKGTIG